MPICIRCRADLPIECFGKDKSRPTGHISHCLKCGRFPAPPKTLESVFWRHLALPLSDEGCWPWQGEIDIGGYGVLYFNKKVIKASRVAYVVQCRDIPDGYIICHHCDNRSCCRGDHLFAGTHKDNTQDAVRKGRLAHGEHHYEAKLTDDIVAELRQRQPPFDWEAIAKQLGVTRITAQRAYHGKTWKHIP